MHDPTARFAYPILKLGLLLLRQLGHGRTPPFDREHARLKELLLAAVPASVTVGPDPVQAVPNRPSIPNSPMNPHPPSDQFLGVRYALVCWLDEVFTKAPDWADRWNERKLEVELYGTNDRAWKFWEQARLAEQHPDSDALEVFFLCVQLGFRGVYADETGRLNEWVVATRERIGQLQMEPTPHDLEPDPVPNVPPRHAEQAFEKMLSIGGTMLLLLIPLAGFLLAFRASR